MKAVIDRIEGEFAIVLFGDKEIKVDIPKTLLPRGSKEGSWLEVDIKLDPEGEKKQREKIQDMMNKLKNKRK